MDSTELERYCTLALVQASDQLSKTSTYDLSWSPGRAVKQQSPLKSSALPQSRLYQLSRNQSCDISMAKGPAFFDKTGIMQKIQQRRASLCTNLVENTDLPKTSNLSLCRPPVVRNRCITRKNASKSDLKAPQWAWNIPQNFHLPPLKGASMRPMQQ